MKNNATLIYNCCLILGDALALLIAFTIAYILRVTLSHEIISTSVHALTYISILASLLPLWIFVFALLGLYNSRIHEQRFSELGRLIVGSIIGIMLVISYSYMTNIAIFPARKVTIYSLALAFVFVLIFRTIARGVRRRLFNYGVGINNVLLVGENTTTLLLARQLTPSSISGYKILGLVSSGTSMHSEVRFKHFTNFQEAVNKFKDQVNMIIQTELYASADRNDEIVTYAQQNHVAYRFVPGNSELFTGNIEVDLFKGVPVIAVHQTALTGWGRVVKRLFDLLVGGLLLIIASPIMLIVAVLVKLFGGGGTILFRQTRLTRFNHKFTTYKFHSQYAKYDGTTPEQAFEMMGRPELSKEYRANADFLPNDPRVSPIGRFLRKTKLDELPQLINVVRGDISLVGPRALVPEELSIYAKKHTILSVKSGLTGLAQVSGQAGISFEDRRKLDLYYVQNWSLWGDIVILVKTVWIVLAQKGTR